MNKDFTLYDEALALKELGFDEPCLNYFSVYGNGKIHLQDKPVICTKLGVEPNVISPTYSQAFRWFRNKHDIVGDVTIFDKGFLEKDKWCYQFRIHLPDDPDNFLIDMHEFKTYEEAELACLRKLIEIVKSKQ